MIRVIYRPEYQEFDSRVRQPGVEFLRKNPRHRGWKGGKFWSRAKDHLREAYQCRCAYTSLYIVDAETVDHFLPKSKYPELAYEWDNYRLARNKINMYKGEAVDIVDPFRVQEGWFVLDLPSCQIRPGKHIDEITKEKIIRTIKVLKLNADDRLVQERCDMLMEFAKGDVGIRHVERYYPFLSSEIKRQQLNRDLLRQVFSLERHEGEVYRSR